MLIFGVYNGEYRRHELLQLLQLLPSKASTVTVRFDGGNTTFQTTVGEIDVQLRATPTWSQGQVYVSLRRHDVIALEQQLLNLDTQRVCLHAQPGGVLVTPNAAQQP